MQQELMFGKEEMLLWFVVFISNASTRPYIRELDIVLALFDVQRKP